jgi:integrase
MTPTEALRVIDAAAPHLRALIVFILCCGARMSEAIDLLWDDVDLTDAKVVLRDTKGRVGKEENRPARLTPAAVVALANLPTDEEGGHSDEVFRRDDGEVLPRSPRTFGRSAHARNKARS